MTSDEINKKLLYLRYKYMKRNTKNGALIYGRHKLIFRRGTFSRSGALLELTDFGWRFMTSGMTWRQFLIEKNVDNITNQIYESNKEKLSEPVPGELTK